MFRDLLHNWTHPMLVYVDDMPQYGDKINTIQKTTQAMNGFGNVVGPKVQPRNTKYTLMSSTLVARQDHYIEITIRSFEMWQSSDTLERQQQIRISFVIKLRGDGAWTMFATIQLRSFRLLICYLIT
jgi:hypothetical protein